MHGMEQIKQRQRDKKRMKTCQLLILALAFAACRAKTTGKKGKIYRIIHLLEF